MENAYEKDNTANDIDNAYRLLAEAIVQQAIIDYKKALKVMEKFKHNPNSGSYLCAYGKAKDIEKFFKSGWFEELTDLNPQYTEKGVQSTIGQNIHKHHHSYNSKKQEKQSADS